MSIVLFESILLELGTGGGYFGYKNRGVYLVPRNIGTGGTVTEIGVARAALKSVLAMRETGRGASCRARPCFCFIV
jgi:hypothetical protein